MNPKEVFHSTAYSVQLPYIAGHSLLRYLKALKIIFFSEGGGVWEGPFYGLISRLKTNKPAEQPWYRYKCTQILH